MANGGKNNNNKNSRSNSNPNQSPEVKRNRASKTFHRFDPRVIAIILLIIAAFAAALYLNEQKQSESVSSLINGLDIDNGDLRINWSRYKTTDIKLSEPLTITQSGTYHITGYLYSGGITIDAGIGEVKLILDNTIINNPTGPAIYCKNAEDLVIELIGNNNLSDGETFDGDYDEDVTGTIYSKGDLVFQGDGTLTINANYQDAIIGKDDLKFSSGTYTISANDDAIRGKDSVYILGGSFVLNAMSDAIKTTNEMDRGKGFILIEDGEISISSTEGEGLEATKEIIINGGTLTINSLADAIHSDNYVGITGGATTITSEDDGIHADNKVSIDGGDIDIIKSYEGIEARVITINGGNTNIVSKDDGINAGGGVDGSSNSITMRELSKTDANCIITINGGNININSIGDGIDSNGSISFNGGMTIVDGPSDNGNGALDSGTDITMSGGTVIAIGASGMANSLGSHSSVYNISVYLESIKPAGTKIAIQNSNGNNIITYTSKKQFSHIAFGTEELKLGDTYSIYIDDELYQSFTISDTTTNIGRRNNYISVPRADGQPINQAAPAQPEKSPTNHPINQQIEQSDEQ